MHVSAHIVVPVPIHLTQRDTDEATNDMTDSMNGITTSSRPVRLLVADEDPLVRAGIASVLSEESDIEVIGSVDDGPAVLLAVRRFAPDVVLLNLRIRGLDAVSAIRALRELGAGERTRVLILSALHTESEIYAALRGGAAGFVCKHSAPAHLATAVREVAAGQGWLDPGITLTLLTEFAARPQASACAPAELSVLTSREREVLALAAHGLSNSELAARLFISEGTVKTHVGRVLFKLGLRDRAQAVATAYQSGLVQVSRRLA